MVESHATTERAHVLCVKLWSDLLHILVAHLEEFALALVSLVQHNTECILSSRLFVLMFFKRVFTNSTNAYILDLGEGGRECSSIQYMWGASFFKMYYPNTRVPL